MDRSKWVRVPRDVTPEMWEAGMNCHSPDDTQGDYLDKVWPAMIAAAPPPPAEQASGEHVEMLREIRLAYGDAPNHFTAEKSALDHAIAALSQRPVARYRLLRDGETILETDEHLSDDANSWRPVGNSLGRGCAYRTGFFMPIRRLSPQQQGGA